MTQYIYEPDQAVAADENPVEPPTGQLTRRRPFVLLAASLLIGTLIVMNSAMSRTSSVDAADIGDQPRRLSVTTLTAQKSDAWQVSRKYTGTIKARRKSLLGSELPGKVVELMVDEGQTVKSGQPVASLDTEQLTTRRLELSAQQSQARSLLEELMAGPRQEVIAAWLGNRNGARGKTEGPT